jgi:hypothetical protein
MGTRWMEVFVSPGGEHQMLVDGRGHEQGRQGDICKRHIRMSNECTHAQVC